MHRVPRLSHGGFFAKRLRVNEDAVTLIAVAAAALVATSVPLIRAVLTLSTTTSWRRRSGFVGWVLAAGSALLFVTAGSYALVSGGFPYGDSVLLRIYRWGFSSASLALALGIASSGRLRVSTVALATIVMLVWAAVAIGE